MRDPGQYKPPFVTETNEARWDDCCPASVLMLVACWTLGEVTDTQQGPVMSERQLKRLRESMRNELLPADQAGGLTPAHAEAMVAKTWPWLPPLPTPRLPFDELWGLLEHGQSAALWGNPEQVKKPDDPLRRWTANDDFGHVICVVRARGERAWIMDPLGRGEYEGQWVDRLALRQFAFRDGDIVRSCALIHIGAMSSAEVNAREGREQARELRVEHRAEVAALQAQIVPVEEARAAARTQALDEVTAAVEALR